MANLAHAIALAAKAHEAQTDKAGAPYILHPLRVMQKMHTEAEMMTAVLHDTVEDTDWTLDGLRGEGFSEEVLAAVDSVTHREGESYEAYLARAAADPIGRKVKLGDLEDNMDLRRLSELTSKDMERLQKYHRLWRKWSRLSEQGGAQTVI
jgi:(p)ppGpp synthase/HD superfamily hydrolase